MEIKGLEVEGADSGGVNVEEVRDERSSHKTNDNLPSRLLPDGNFVGSCNPILNHLTLSQRRRHGRSRLGVLTKRNMGQRDSSTASAIKPKFGSVTVMGGKRDS